MNTEHSANEIQWLTRWGSVYEPKTEVKRYHRAMLGSEPIVRGFKSGKPYDINLAKGTAKYDYDAICDRCGGQGGGEQWARTGWTCFACGGTGQAGVKAGRLYTAERLAKLNATKAKRDKAIAEKRAAEHEVRKAQWEVERVAKEAAFLAAYGPAFERVKQYGTETSWDSNLDEMVPAHPFLADLVEKQAKYGSLSQGQMDAAIASIDKMESIAAAKAASQYVGAVGKRQDFVLTVEQVVTIETASFSGYGKAYIYIHLCRDENGNRIVYKGSGDFPYRGQTAKVKATVSEHEEYRGEKQTKISRPKVLETIKGADDESVPENETEGELAEVAL